MENKIEDIVKIEQRFVLSRNQPGHEIMFGGDVNKYLGEGWKWVPGSLVGVDTDHGPKWAVFLQREVKAAQR